MPRGKAVGPGKRVLLNREAVEAIRLGYADGLQAVGEAILERTRPVVPDAPSYGVGLVDTGQAVTYVDRKKVAGQGSAPRGSVPKELGTVVGYGFPGRFNEVGTVKQPPRPFLTPGFAATAAEGGDMITAAMTARLRRAGNAS